jgi:trimethylamine--corrinoid protein Co-methyltransferase
VITVGCLLDGLLVFDYATLAISAEIALMVKRVARGLDFGEENPAVEAITEVGPGGLFLDTAHTLERMRTTALLPEIADRSPRSQWQANGAQDAHSRALRRVREILARDNPAVFSPDLDAQIRAEFSDLVAGDPS